MQEEINRKIIISNIIDESMAEEVITRILDINDYDEQMSVLSTYKAEPIEIFINSPGGSATDGFAIIGAMEMSDTPIITYGLGTVASIALGIFKTGDFKISARHTRYMYHSVAYGAGGQIKDHEDSHKEANILQNLYDCLFENTNLTKEMMEDIRDKKANLFMSAEEAKKLGLVDEILEKQEKNIQMVSEEEYKKLQQEMKNMIVE